jgi:hypothetical protein
MPTTTQVAELEQQLDSLRAEVDASTASSSDAAAAAAAAQQALQARVEVLEGEAEQLTSEVAAAKAASAAAAQQAAAEKAELEQKVSRVRCVLRQGPVWRDVTMAETLHTCCTLA